MPELHPLHTSGNDTDGPQSPEGLLISAFLEIGDFTPAQYQVKDNDILAWRRLWDYSMRYQAIDGHAPPLSLVQSQYPDFQITCGVSAAYAADRVKEASAMRGLRQTMAAAAAALGDEDMNGAFSLLEQIRRPAGTGSKPPMDTLDHISVAHQVEVSRIPTPYPTLGRATKGIGPGEFWLLAARHGQGKSWVLADYAAHAAKAGYKVGYASYEMGARAISRRVNSRLADGNPTMFMALIGDDEVAAKQALDELSEQVSGRVEVFDPSHGRVNTTGFLRDMCSDKYDLVIADHVGLLLTDEGKRAAEDWRLHAIISNVLKEHTLSTGTPILASSQVNREAEKIGGDRPPRTANLSGTDALGQDADVVITMRRLTACTMYNSAEKVREGPNLRWWSYFDPARNRFQEISELVATEQRAMDRESGASID